jgi:hypothetical protein
MLQRKPHCHGCHGRGTVEARVDGLPIDLPCSFCMGAGRRSRAFRKAALAAKEMAKVPPEPQPPPPGRRWLDRCVSRFMQGWTVQSLSAWSGHAERDIEDEIRRALVASLRRQSSRERHEESLRKWGKG